MLESHLVLALAAVAASALWLVAARRGPGLAHFRWASSRTRRPGAHTPDGGVDYVSRTRAGGRPCWGADPLVALLVGLAVALAAGVILYVSGPSLLDAGVFGVVPFAAACVAVVLGAAMVVMAAADRRTAVEVTGQIVRLRTFGDDKSLRYYVAVDDGESESIRAWKVSRARYEGLEQGDVVTARLTRNLGCVRSFIRAGTPPVAG